MKEDRLLQLAQQLEWLGCEASFRARRTGGLAAGAFLEKQAEVLATADKIERELKGAVCFNLTSLVGVEYPLDWTLDSIADLLAAVEDIRRSALGAIQELPPKVRRFTHQVERYLTSGAALAA